MIMKPLTHENYNSLADLKKRLQTENKSATALNSLAIDVTITLETTEFTPVFDYVAWLDTLESPADYLSSTEVLNAADMDTIRKIATANIRLDRFNEGYLEKLIEAGYFNTLLSRVESLKN